MAGPEPGRLFDRKGIYHKDLVARGRFQATILEVSTKYGKAYFQPPGDQKTNVLTNVHDHYLAMWEAAPRGVLLWLEAAGADAQAVVTFTQVQPGEELNYMNGFVPTGGGQAAPTPQAPAVPTTPAPQPAPAPATPAPAPSQGSALPASIMEAEADALTAATHLLTRFVQVEDLTAFQQADLLWRMASHLSCRQRDVQRDVGVRLPIVPGDKRLAPARPWGMREGRVIPPGSFKPEEVDRMVQGQRAIIEGLLPQVQDVLMDVDREAIDAGLNNDPPPSRGWADQTVAKLTALAAKVQRDKAEDFEGGPDMGGEDDLPF